MHDTPALGVSSPSFSMVSCDIVDSTPVISRLAVVPPIRPDTPASKVSTPTTRSTETDNTQAEEDAFDAFVESLSASDPLLSDGRGNRSSFLDLSLDFKASNLCDPLGPKPDYLCSSDLDWLGTDCGSDYDVHPDVSSDEASKAQHSRRSTSTSSASGSSMFATVPDCEDWTIPNLKMA